MNTKNMFFVLSLVVAGFAGMGLNAQAHEVEEVNEWNKRLESGKVAPEHKKDAYLRLAAISTPEYIESERAFKLLNQRYADLREIEASPQQSLFNAMADEDLFLLSYIQDSRTAKSLKKEISELLGNAHDLADKATQTPAYNAWYNQ